MIFESFSVIQRQISLGVHSYAVVHFPCLTKKSFKNRDFWVFSLILRQISLGVPTVRRRSFSLSYEKILQKSKFLGLCRNARSNFTRSTFVRCRSFSLSYEKIFQKSRFWVFSVILRQISLGVHSYAVVHFPCLTKKSCKNRDFETFRRYCVKFRSEYRQYAVVHFPCLTKKSFKNRDFGFFGDTAINITRSTDSTPSFIFRQSDQVCNALYI